MVKKIKDLNIMVDPKIEFLSVVEFLSGCLSEYLLTKFNFKYKEDVVKYFSKYKSHRCVKIYTDLCAQDFNFDAPVTTVLYLSSLPEMKIERNLDNNLVKRAGGKERLYKFVEELSKFAKETKFLEFFDSHTQFYSSIVKNFNEKMKGFHIVESLERYYGKREASYNIVLVPLFCGCYGPRLKKKTNKYDLYAVIGPTGIDKRRRPHFDPNLTKLLCLHEFSHSFVNPVTEKFEKDLDKYSLLFEPISDKMKHLGYFDWKTCVNEHIVRAITGRMHFTNSIKEKENYLTEEENKGFIYIRVIDEKMSEYERLRDRYPRFEDFYSEIIKVWRNLYRKWDEEYRKKEEDKNE